MNANEDDAINNATHLGNANNNDECDKRKDSELDEEGLKKNGYDVVLFGTGLTQSILASALTRAGKSILHCDGNDFYGEREAVFSLGSLMHWTHAVRHQANQEENSVKDDSSLEINSRIINVNPSGVLSKIQILSETNVETIECLKSGMHVVTPYGEGIIQNLPSCNNCGNESNFRCSSLEVQLKNWVMANGKSPTAYFGYHEPSNKDGDKQGQLNKSDKISCFYAKNHDIIPTGMFHFQKYILDNKRYYALDLTPGLLYANGDAVDGLIESGVSQYCEFKSVLGLHLFMKQDTTSSKNREKPNLNEEVKNKNLFQISRVPCSKGDVFKTKLLSPVEKRKLMKFLQIAFDFATSSSFKKKYDSQIIGDVNALTGGAMDNISNLEEDAVTSLNERQLQQGRSLYRPQNKTVSTSDIEKLQQCIDAEMDFETYLEIEHKLPERLRNIVIYALAMGSHYQDGDKHYTTGEGMRDLSLHLLSLGRFGSTAFLAPLYGAGELSQSFCRSAAVHGGTYLLRRAIRKVLLDTNNNVRAVSLDDNTFEYNSAENIDRKQKEISTTHVVLPSDVTTLKGIEASNRKILRRISILRGKLKFDTDNTDPNVNTEQRHIIVIPPNTIGNEYVIHGVVLDESVHVAPLYKDGSFTTTILHLTTICDEEDKNGEILKLAARSIIENQNESNKTNDFEELYHICFSYDFATITLNQKMISSRGLHICNSYQSITVESAFRTAESIFHQICPNSVFLKYSQEMVEKVKESRFGIPNDEDDHEKAVLDSAMNMMSSVGADDAVQIQ